MNKVVILEQSHIRRLAASNLLTWLKLPEELTKKSCNCSKVTSKKKELLNNLAMSILGASPEDKQKMKTFFGADVLKIWVQHGQKKELFTI